ncbi:MAG: hypothetical protein H0U16_01350 [Actinobacteria bacterium]|nr:hypothetical protein [Actinomycetota bacterium]
MTNDTAAFNSAMNAAAAGVTYVPDGTYSLDNLFPKSGATLRGQSRAGTILTRASLGAHASPGFIHFQSVANSTVENFTIFGTGKRLEDTGQLGRGDDILINLIDARSITVRNISFLNAQGIGIMTEGPETYGGLFEDISITNTYVRDNGYHGVALWLFNGTHGNTFRRISVDGADYAGVAIDAGSTVGPAAAVDDNVFEDITIRNAARYYITGGEAGAGWIFHGGNRNSVTRYEITDIPQGVAMALGTDQSGLGARDNRLYAAVVARIASGIVAAFDAGAIGNIFDDGMGGGQLTGNHSQNTFLNWPGLYW